MMDILLVTNYFAPDLGAASTRLTRLAYQLQARGHQVTVLTSLPHYPQGKIRPVHRGRLVVVEDRSGVRVVQTWLWATTSPRMSRKLISQISFMMTALGRGLFFRKPDVILIEAQPIFTSLAGVILALFKRRPYVLNVSDLWPDHLLSVGTFSEQHPIYRLARAIVDWTYQRAARITAMSPAWTDKIVSYIGQEDKVQTLYNGVDLQKFRPNLDTTTLHDQHQLPDGDIVLFLGTLATQYDLDVLDHAMHALHDRPNTHFLFVGSGSQAEKLQAILQRHHNVIWLQWIDAEHIHLAWNVATVTFWAMRDHPLYHGTIPAKLYEALACGVPVVAMQVGVTQRIIMDAGAGIAVDLGDQQGFNSALRHLLDDQDFRQQCSIHARQYAEQHYDPERVADGYEAILKHALDEA
jgi:colanic acid biosynthesis glycosyl transferase WcaI